MIYTFKDRRRYVRQIYVDQEQVALYTGCVYKYCVHVGHGILLDRYVTQVLAVLPEAAFMSQGCAVFVGKPAPASRTAGAR